MKSETELGRLRAGEKLTLSPAASHDYHIECTGDFFADFLYYYAVY